MSALRLLPQSQEKEILAERIVWLPKWALDLSAAEADDKYPLETGGVFMGWHADKHNIVVSMVFGPGSNAKHKRTSFEPDHSWQLNKIAEHYRSSGNQDTYLGDWHSHPDSTRGSLSMIDRKALRKIIRTPSARCSTPIMAILFGVPASWSTEIWWSTLKPKPFSWTGVIVEATQQKIY